MQELTSSQIEARELECIKNDRALFSKLGFVVHTHQALSVEGPNGSGKTSLLRIICGLSRPERGEILWCGQNIESVRSEYYAQVTYVGHSCAVKDELTVIENLHFAQALASNNTSIDLQEVLHKMNLRDVAEVACKNISAGQKRRLALARLALTSSRVWILDEPFTALDKAAITATEGMCQAHVQSGGILILATHRPAILDGIDVIHLQLG